MLKYGPQTEAIKTILTKIKNSTSEQVERLNASRDTADYATYTVARYDAHHAICDAAEYAAWDTVRFAAYHAVLDAARYAAWDTVRDASYHTIRDAAWDAVLAIITKDKISQKTFDILYGPWGSVMD